MGNGKAKANGKGNGKGFGMMQQQNMKQVQQHNLKGKANGKGKGKANGQTHPKEELGEAVSLLLGQVQITKDDILYEMEQLEDQRFIATLSIPGMGDGRTFKGVPGRNKK